LFQFLGRFGAMIGEVPGLDFRAVVCVDMIAPQAETNASDGGEVGTAAFTVGARSLALWGQNAEVNLLCVGGDFRRQPILTSMFGTRTKLDRAIAVVALLHRQTANANAIIATLPIVPDDFTEVPVH
jgi:uncharacterized RmlC-like cupin family protein